MTHEDYRDEKYSDCIALVTNDIRKLFIQAGIDPLGTTYFELGVKEAIGIMAQAIQSGEIGKYNWSN